MRYNGGMPQRSRAKDELGLVLNVYELVTAYEEISVVRMQAIRQAVLSTRAFVSALAKVFADVRTSQVAAVVRDLHQRRPLLRVGRQPRAALPEAQRPLLVLLTPNTRLSGTIIEQVFQQFMTYLEQHPSDLLIVGRVGRQFFQNVRPGYPFAYLELPSRPLTAADVHLLLERTRPYHSVRVFYGRFETFVANGPAVADLGEYPLVAQGAEEHEPVPFLFEPSLLDVMRYFDREIMAALVTQAAYESQLAVVGGRVTAMEAATQRIEQRRRVLAHQALSEVRVHESRKQREQLASLALWGL